MKVKSLFKQVDEKHLHAEVDLMLWSPKMDLIALSMITGEVCLFRLSWQKVWSVPQRTEHVFVSSLAWRPDGKVLAIGYTNGKIRLYSIEDASFIIEHHVSDKSVISMHWVADFSPNKSFPENVNHLGELELHNAFKDASAEYLPELPPLQNSQENSKPKDDVMRLKGLKYLSILVAGTKCSYVKLYAFGIISIGYLDMSENLKEVLNVNLSDKLTTFNVMGLAKDKDEMTLVTYNCNDLYKNKEEIKYVSLKLGQILTLIEYMFEVIKQMSEVWEDILLEIESKLKKFAKDKFQASGHSLRYEFLRLLLYGYPSDDLKLFLQFDLKKQSLTKLASSVQNSYSQIQKLLVKNFTIVSETIIFHLNGLLGISRWHDRFLHLGLDESSINSTVSMAGALMMKNSEMQKVIDVSIRNFKAFYKWLYPIKQKLSGETVPPNLGNLSQQEINFVAQFINDNFASEEDFKLEKVGQYLKNDNLPNPIVASDNLWEKFLSQIGCNLNSSVRFFFYDSYRYNSLVQVAKMLQKNFEITLNTCAMKMKNYFQITSTQNLKHSFPTTGNDEASLDLKFYVTSVNVSKLDSEPCTLYTITCRPVEKKNFYLLMKRNQEGFSIANFSFMDPEMSEPYDLIDVSFYNDNLISLLLQDENAPRTIQYNMNWFLPFLQYSTDVTCLNDVPHEIFKERVEEGERCKVLENMRTSKFAISGMRRVACILFSSKKRVRIFLTDVEEDEDDEDSTVATGNNNVSMSSFQVEDDGETRDMKVDGDSRNDGDINKENDSSL